MDLRSLVSSSWDGWLPEAWQWLTRTSVGMTEDGWLDRNVPGWACGADGLPDDAALRRVADVTHAPDPESLLTVMRISQSIVAEGDDVPKSQSPGDWPWPTRSFIVVMSLIPFRLED